MLDSIEIAKLYENVLEADKRRYNITDEAIKFGIECMAHVYGENVGLNSKRSLIADYTDPAHRCAYLHKYAALHTGMVRDMLAEAIRDNYKLFHRLVYSGDRFRMCSLGGGPGTDVIGAMSALHASFGYFDASATVVDYMAEWGLSFESILRELGSGWYGAFGNNISYYLNWRYVGANLLKRFQPDVLEALSTASLVSMIKFTSAAACKDTYAMITNIFTTMKPGAALLFIDNDGGGFRNLIETAAKELNFISIYGPYRRENFNYFFRKRKFGYNSCCKTRVTVHVLQKPYVMSPYCDNFPNLARYMPENRVILGSNSMPGNSLLGSPPTPFLYLGQSPVTPGTLVQRSPILPSPPAQYRLPDVNGNCLGYAPADGMNQNFVQDENISNSHFISSPVEEIVQSPRYAIMPPTPVVHTPSYNIHTPLAVHVISTPDTLPRKGKKQGCFPLKINNFRHHLAAKVNKVKSRARLIFKKKKKVGKSHPIFEL